MSVVSDKILLLGLGNDILTDDAIGLNVVRRLCGNWLATTASRCARPWKWV